MYQRRIHNFSKIRTLKKDDLVAKHCFTKKNHTKENLKVTGIEKVLGTKIYRKVKESSLDKKKLNTVEPEDSIHNMNENEQIGCKERHKYNYNVMFLCICNCCSNVECNSNEVGRNGRNVWNMCYSINFYIYKNIIYILINMIIGVT